MALPTYKSRGIMYAPLPKADTSALREQERFMDTLTSRLDQLQSMVKKEGIEYAKEKALKFALENPITRDELETGKYSQEDAKSWTDAFSGGNVYQDTLRLAQANILGNQLNLEAAKEIERIEKQAENGMITFADAKAQMDSMIKGFSASIAGLDADTALKTRAVMSTTAKTSLQAIGEREAKTYRANMLTQLASEKNVLVRRMETAFYVGDGHDPETGPYAVEDVIDNLSTSYQLKATAINAADEISAIPELVNAARVNGVTRWALDENFAKTATEGFSRLEANDLGPRHQALWDRMTDDERNSVKDTFLKEIASKKKLQDDALEVNKGALMRNGYDLIDQWFAEKDPANRDSIRLQLYDINSQLESKFVSDSLINKMRKNDYDGDEASTEFMATLERQIDTRAMINGKKIDRDYLVNLANSDEISMEQLRVLQNRFKSTENATLRNEIKMARAVVAEMADQGYISRRNRSQTEDQIVGQILQRYQDGESVLGLGKSVANSAKADIVTEERTNNLQLIVTGLEQNLSDTFPNADWETIAREMVEDESVLDDYLDPDDPEYRSIRNTIKGLLEAWK